jgi:hypothetical protein
MAMLWWAFHPGPLGEAHDLGAFQAPLGVEVDVLDDGPVAQLGGLQVALHAPVLAFGDLPVDQQAQALLETEPLVGSLVALLGQARCHCRQLQRIEAVDRLVVQHVVLLRS